MHRNIIKRIKFSIIVSGIDCQSLANLNRLEFGSEEQMGIELLLWLVLSSIVVEVFDVEPGSVGLS